MLLKVPDYKDFWWDTAPPEERNRVILQEQLIPVLLYAKDQVPFYREHYRGVSRSTIQSLSSLEEYADVIPPVTKVHLATNHPRAFMPPEDDAERDRHRGSYWRFGTGGTTDKPSLVIHSMGDWRAMTLHANRGIEFDFHKDPTLAGRFDFNRQGVVEDEFKCLNTPLNGARIFGAYNADHVTNNIYATMLTALGCDFYWRTSTRSSVADNYELMRDFKVNGVLAPPGGSLKPPDQGNHPGRIPSHGLSQR